MLRLHIIIASTRPGRVGPTLGRWFYDHARTREGMLPRLIDLAEVGLPMFDEPHHPRLQRYEHEHTRRWSAAIAEADAFVFVVPEYNHGPTPALVNALDYLVVEWACKPAGFVSYGGVSGGLRAVQATKPILNALKVVPLPEGVVAPNFAAQVKDGVFTPNDLQVSSADALLKELERWAAALKPLRS